MKEGRTMLGGRRYKIIREELEGEWVNDVAAYEDGEDLCVTPKVFDALEDAEKRGVRSANAALSGGEAVRSKGIVGQVMQEKFGELDEKGGVKW